MRGINGVVDVAEDQASAVGHGVDKHLGCCAGRSGWRHFLRRGRQTIAQDILDKRQRSLGDGSRLCVRRGRGFVAEEENNGWAVRGVFAKDEAVAVRSNVL